MKTERPTARFGGAVWRHGAAAALVWILCGSALGQAPAPAEYQVYTLKHKSAADVEKVLAEMLAGTGSSTHVVADLKGNQVLVRGPEKAQQLARDLIGSMDRPAARPVPDAKPLVKSYPCPEERRAETLAKLRSLDGPRGEVRAAVDPQSGEILVLAPAAVHAEIASWLAGPSDRGTLRELPPAAGASPGPEYIPLVCVRASEMESTLRELFRLRLVPLPERHAGIAEYRHAGVRGGGVELGFDLLRNAVIISGPAPAAAQWARLVRRLDAPPQAQGQSTEVVPLYYADPRKVQEAVEAYRSGFESSRSRRLRGDQGRIFDHNGIELVSYLFQIKGDAGAGEKPAEGGAPKAAPSAPPPGAAPLPGEKPPAAPGEDRVRALRELGLDVEIETLPDLDAIIIRGRKRDVEEIKRLIQEIERLSAETEPAIDVYQLRHVQGEALSTILRQVQADVLAGRQGRVTILPLGKPNALLLIGWGEAVKKAKELIAKLDQPVDPQTQQRVFRLRYASATTVATTITQFFSTPTGLEPRVHVTPDPRTNSLAVQAAPRDLAEVEMLLEKLDSPDSATVFRTRIFKLYNTLANDVFATLQGAIDAARGGGTAGQKSAALELLSIDPNDPKRERLLRSGILNDVRVTPDARLNILVVAAPPESMDLLAALIKELDSPGAVAQIKVFRIVNGDAAGMVQMLRSLLPAQTGAGGPQLSVSEGEPSTMGLRFSIDQRTNSIIVIGSTGDLRIVEALILRLDALDVQQRKTSVHRLKNSPAVDVATAVNRFLSSQRQVQMAAPGAFSPFQQIESEVVVVPETVSNVLIISATPRFYQEITDLVEKLDAQPSQVMIQVLIAEVSLRNTDEFGVELGLQDSVLFDRNVLSGNLTTQTKSTQQSTPSGIITQTEQLFPAATLNPGYLFNSPILGNGAGNIAGSNLVGGQGLSNLGVGRLNSELGFGGLVLSASSESVSVLIRALQESQRLEVLGRPHVMTLDNQPAFIQIGKRVPRITGSMAPTLGTGQVFNTFVMENVGLILGVTPRISPDGTVVMEIDAEKSEVGPLAEGTPVSFVEGKPIYSPSINTTMAQTTVSAADGETIVLGGLITKKISHLERKVPYLGDIPVLGNLFTFRSNQCTKTELLIVLTPHVVRSREEAERIKRIESARMHWCLQSVQEIHCDAGLTSATAAGQVVYPHINPRGSASGGLEPGKPRPLEGRPEVVPTPPPLEDLRAPAPIPPEPAPRAMPAQPPALEGPIGHARNAPAALAGPIPGYDARGLAEPRLGAAGRPGSAAPVVYHQPMPVNPYWPGDAAVQAVPYYQPIAPPAAAPYDPGLYRSSPQ